ncbi:membrane-spanning 4-domains subfamily A member 4A-like isoform X1 [Malaclemys terrapin pileata]|uniref:membrane-spanning 4-domains subfamily A member 4A-like isoform X1 n=1 Tax=Malaclemys terrapin pileata TaxID=2991368 RepID=UPI0023A81F84|nr:membrane-spanning 4-domains subfamily A member 4A-like isoform X1 [Malaclemys terrapin pileata]XP_053866461.1 membrane-spanning 4-domains subfamily A member 4A-like isoform X1 [Malaclemys terrapin pileata]
MEAGPSGVVLLTQIIPQPHSSDSSAPPRPLRKFYQGEPLALGITQILMGIVQVAFGIILNLANGYQIIAIQAGTPFWTGILYILSGFICVTAAKNPKISLVKAMLAMNTLSAIVAGVGIALYSLSLIFYYPHGTCQWIEESKSCAPTSRVPADTMLGVTMILLAFTILEFCISISSAAFGCKTLCRDSYGDTVTASVRGDRGLGFRGGWGTGSQDSWVLSQAQRREWSLEVKARAEDSWVLSLSM